MMLNDMPRSSDFTTKLLGLIGYLVLFFLMLPTIIVIPMSFSDSQYLEFPPTSWSFRWYREYFGSSAWTAATWTSLLVALVTTIVSTPLGTIAAYGMHCASDKIRKRIQLFVLIPIIVPSILVAIGAFHLYSIVNLNYSISGLVLAHSALAIPFVIITVLSSLNNYDMTQEMAARSMGASRARAFLSITLPQIRFSVFTGAFLAFITSLDEVVVAKFISGGENATITRRMFNALRDQIDPTISAISTCLIVISVLALAAVQLFGSRSNKES